LSRSSGPDPSGDARDAAVLNQAYEESENMRPILTAALIAMAAPMALVAVPVAAEAPAAGGLSVETTDLGTLLDNPAAKAVLVKHLPSLVENEQIQMARSLTLKQLQQYTGDGLTDEKLAAVQADLDKLPK
jgi:para-nitrobenzyl esterase